MRLHYLLILFLTLTSCKKEAENRNTDHLLLPPPKASKIEIKWLAENTVKLKIDSLISYQKGFESDSVIGINYIGFEGEHYFYPINERGQFINTILKKQKLTSGQISKLSSIIGNKKTYENPNIAGCYEPRLAFIYFKNNEVICQTQICLECSQLASTAETVKNADGDFNKEAYKELKKINSELGFK